MNRKHIVMLLVVFALMFLLGSAAKVVAQDTQPPSPTPTPVDPYFFEKQGQSSDPYDSQRGPERQDFLPNAMNFEQPPDTGQRPEDTGGPDDYGYTWNDEVTFSWIDATTGINTGLQGDDQYTGLIDIGFPFQYYENTYPNVSLTTNGLLIFEQGAYYFSNRGIPNPAPPNNYISPFWDDLCVNMGGYNFGSVFYKQGGIAPNRYFVAEWYQISLLGTNDLITFEVIIHENGDIVMQYLSLSGILSSATVGIEDKTGMDGLQYLYNNYGLENGLAIRYYRPGPTARVKIYPLYQGHFTYANQLNTFQVPIINIGDLGPDTYDLEASSSWPIWLFAEDGMTLLTDTDGDSIIDTGPVDGGSTFTVIAKIQTPNPANVGDNNPATITARSSLNSAKSKLVTLSAAIPAPFAQVYSDDSDGVMSLYMMKPSEQSLRKASVHDYYGREVSVAEAPNGNLAYLWNRYRCLGDNCDVYIEEIEYTILDHSGNVISPVRKLVDHSGATISTYDMAAAVATTPDGRTGVLWARDLYNQNNHKYNYNIFFTILDVSGNIIYGPTNLTNNNLWGSYSDNGIPQFYSPRISATGDNRFVLAWERYSRETGGSLEDIYYAVRDSNNNPIRGVTKFTNDTPGNGQTYYGPTLSSLNNSRVFLAWCQAINYYLDTAFAVLDSSGNIVKSATTLNSFTMGNIDATQLSDGHIMLAGTSWGGANNPQIAYAIFDSSYNLTTGPTYLDNPAAAAGDAYVSITADQDGRAILTWMDYDYSYRPNLYYALINGNGEVITQPMIFRTAKPYWGSSTIQTSFEGYGNTTYSMTPTTLQVDTYISSHSTVGAPPGGTGIIPISFGNNGLSTATSVIITAILDINLSYIADTSGVIPTFNGNTITWNLPADMSFMGYGQFSVWVAVPNTPFGSIYPVTLQIESAGPESYPSDNIYDLNVMVAHQIFEPILNRTYP